MGWLKPKEKKSEEETEEEKEDIPNYYQLWADEGQVSYLSHSCIIYLSILFYSFM